jgi:glyoxylase-like metal-dependent hydrolase (beta-lactamase superfamily II)
MGAVPRITAFFDEPTNTATYLVADVRSGTAAVIDPVLDFDLASGRIQTRSADAILEFAGEQGLTIAWVLETHPHADHLTAAAYIKARTGARTGIGRGVIAVQEHFASLLDAADVTPGDFDRLLDDGDSIALGELSIKVIATPGHTPACVSYVVGDGVFVGDTLFMPDYGTARTDFPGGDARQLYRSIKRILALPEATRLFLCHDYKAPGRDAYAWESTVAKERDCNIHIGHGTGEDAFVAMRTVRDSTLSPPKLLYPALQVNIRGGRLPPASPCGSQYLRIPLNFGPAETG